MQATQADGATLCPYKGLVPYAEEDARFFFGREADRQIVTANLYAARLTILYGASGVGKSSLLQAGVLAYLHQIPGQAAVLFNRWQVDPVAGLKLAVAGEVARVLPEGADKAGGRPAHDRDEPTLDRYLERQAHGLRGPLVIILDQFEEFFLYDRSDEGPRSFAAEFARAVNSAECPASFLVSLREDALAKLDRFERRVPRVYDNYLRVEHLDREAAREAITRPLAVYNAEVRPERPVAIEDALVERVVEEVRTGKVLIGQVGHGELAARPDDPDARVEAPYLQLVLTRLWDEEARRNSPLLRLDTLARLGGAERIVRTHLDEQLALLTPDQQEVAAQIFHYLVTPSGAKIAHRVDDLADYAELPAGAVRRVAALLAMPERRVLRAVAPPGVAPATEGAAPGDGRELRYEIFHDVLAQPALDWRARYLGRSPLSRNLVLLLVASLVLGLLATAFARALPPLALILARGVALLVSQTVVLMQVYQFFARYARLSTGRLPVSGASGANLGAVLGVLLAVLWYAATNWPRGMVEGLAAATAGEYLGYFVGTAVLTLGAGFATFMAMLGAGRLTLWRFRRFSLGFYGAYLAACVLIVAMAVLQALAEPLGKWIALSMP